MGVAMAGDELSAVATEALGALADRLRLSLFSLCTAGTAHVGRQQSRTVRH